MKIAIDNMKFDAAGLIPVVVQDARTRQVLTLAYMNAESLTKTFETNETWFWSRSRSRLWHKGETSGNSQRVVEVLVDCDRDALTVLVQPNGPACHTGSVSCFHNTIHHAGHQDKPVEGSSNIGDVLDRLYTLIESRKRDRPENSYTTYLFEQGLDKILKKIGEESAETIIAAKNDEGNALVKESSDLLYHLLVLLVERGVSLAEVRDEFISREKA